MVRLDRVKDARESAGYTQEDVAKVLGYKSANAVGNKEQGDRSFSPDDLAKMSEMFHVSADWLLGLSNNKDEYRYDITAAELKLIRLFREASDRDKDIVMNILQTSIINK